MKEELRIMRSNGGVATPSDHPLSRADSPSAGPAAGVLGGAVAGALSGHRNLITFDVGGTRRISA